MSTAPSRGRGAGFGVEPAVRPGTRHAPGQRITPAGSDRRLYAQALAHAAGARWWRPYLARVRTGDLAAIATAVSLAYAVGLTHNGLPYVEGELSPPYVLVALVVGGMWLLAIEFGETRHRRIVGNGNREYQRVVGVSWRLFTAIGLASYLLKMSTGRIFLATAFSVGTLLLLLNRWNWRRRLHARRRRGESMARVLVVGPPANAARLTTEFGRNPLAGYTVVGVCVPSLGTSPREKIADALVLGDFGQVAHVARLANVDLVAVAGADDITAEALQNLSWDLEGSGIDVSVTLSLVDVAGPRFFFHPAGNLPLVFVDEPKFTGSKFALKSVVDWISAALLVLLLAPLLLATALAVRLSSPGPVIYRQTRIGRDGKAFRIYKFRSMYQDADLQLDEVMGGETPLFYKRQDDPRVTPIGRLLRRYSIDELPQLWNVLRGQMSLVGPRPQIGLEVAQYDRKAARRLLVKPGLTGLWQVSGRSSLSVEDSIRLDVYYVENWTLFGDFLILLRTIRAVTRGDGAF